MAAGCRVCLTVNGLPCGVVLRAPAVRELEAWTKAEMLQLTTKLNAVVSRCASHQQQTNVQTEALLQHCSNFAIASC